jgi:hypothetical protein
MLPEDDGEVEETTPQRRKTTMTAALLDFRLHENMAEALLKEVAILEPAERSSEEAATAELKEQVLQEAARLSKQFYATMERGISPPQAVNLAHSLIRSANVIGTILDLLVTANPSRQEFRNAVLAYLIPLKDHARDLLRLAEMPLPAPDPERAKRSMEEMERGEGFTTQEILAELQDQ